MAERRIVTVFGGSGFIGRYLVRRLAADGHVVRIAVRDTEGALFLKTAGAVGQIVPLYASLSEPGTIGRAIEGADSVVNLVGILAERRRGDFNRIHAEGAGHIASLCAQTGVSRLVHVSAIGADPASKSRYGASKAHGEEAVRSAFPRATILRPSIVFGPEDQFLNRFARMAQLLPFMPVIKGGTKFQPVYVGDVAAAIHAALLRADAAGQTYELGGPRVLTFRALLQYILEETRRRRPMVTIPDGLAAVQASLAQHLPTRPFTPDQLAMLDTDNVVSPDMAGLKALGISPTPIELIAPTYLRRYRVGGAKRPDVILERVGS